MGDCGKQTPAPGPWNGCADGRALGGLVGGGLLADEGQLAGDDELAGRVRDRAGAGPGERFGQLRDLERGVGFGAGDREDAVGDAALAPSRNGDGCFGSGGVGAARRARVRIWVRVRRAGSAADVSGLG